MITLDGVSYAYPDAEVFALENIELHVPEREILGIVGASGAGKTTLAKAIAGFIPHVDGGELSGSVVVDGTDLAGVRLSDAVSKVGLVIQNPFNQISGAKYTVRDEIAFGLENIGTPRADMIDQVQAAAELLRISHLLDRSPYALSGGQQQLVAIASMIVMRTPVLVMDEPTSQLDPAGTRMVFDVLSALRDAGTTVIILEHKLELLREHADRIAVIADRTIAAIGGAQEILADPRTEEWGIGSTRVTTAARMLAAQGRFETSQTLPVSVEDAVVAFGTERS
ncbi:energy-coupling factor transporter ATP-binding protein EcfA2 [Microbacterium keratanolyticum]|uniref:ABC transporter ATP-binding protein n=1 Tax=Microbacterium keratanolyticum TaxID=67574 RepID=A0A9W6HRR1_9MICO|nr:ABC transporter ATP-binding protein [Microbacterium keratanolyticum]MBM7468842.1 energy-coupling factor transporter ATP-binding protein EcfA2 [Microbacterium keratanolyticum]GLK00919.1 ABC transporter ATP-binding protein [Microbacterium keratanolyticum]